MISGISSVLTSESTTSATKADSSIVGKDEFLKLLTYQLKNQNPLKPYDNQEFASQLAQFSQLEQLIDIKSLMEETANMNALLSQTMSNTALPGMLGKNATAMTNIMNYDGDTAIPLGYEAASNASKGNITIKNEAGYIVDTITLSEDQLTSGKHKINWTGKDSDGKDLPAGKYTFSVELADEKGTSYSADTFIEGKVEAVRFKSEGTMLVIGGNEIALGKVVDISSN